MNTNRRLGLPAVNLDDFYKDLPERAELVTIKKATRKRTRR